MLLELAAMAGERRCLYPCGSLTSVLRPRTSMNTDDDGDDGYGQDVDDVDDRDTGEASDMDDEEYRFLVQL